MIFAYVVGAQCTGKTTLSVALIDALRSRSPQLRCELLTETARRTLKLHGFAREDVRNGGERCLELQRLIMEDQIERELLAEKQDIDIVVSDRSGLDPMVYARMYCEERLVTRLESNSRWSLVRDRLRAGVVIVCEPIMEWLLDDGVRLLPENWQEWRTTHECFCRFLQQNNIAHAVLPSTTRDLATRVEFVMQQVRPIVEARMVKNDTKLDDEDDMKHEWKL